MTRSENPVLVHISNWHIKWIIGGIFREAAEACSVGPSWRVYATSKKDYLNPRVWMSKLKPEFGELNIYAHQDTFFSIFANSPDDVKRKRNRVFFTHLNDGQSISKEQITSLQYCERILVQNEVMENILISQGISKSRIFRAPGAVDRAIYSPASKLPESRYVLFSGNFKYRKNPELIEQVIALMPDVDFVVHGLNWDEFSSQFLYGYPNLKRLEFDLNNQPHLMRQASLYVSLARIEGGPIPVLEALASGTPVLATNTGFCSEFINDSNGRVLPNPPNLELVTSCIREVIKLKKNIWDRDLLDGAWRWQDLGQIIYL
jgi:glycosyltransferase involved in cell wall biosynthesis